MKFILESQIPGFQAKSKAEKKDIRRMAMDQVKIKYTISMTVVIVILIQGVNYIKEHIFNTDSFWLRLIIAVLLSIPLGIIVTGFTVNPKIKELIEEI
jgi:hypothetical protein